MGITRVVDVLEHYPRRYIDRTARAMIGDVALGEEVTVFAEVSRIGARRTRRGRALVEAVITDGTSDLSVVFFNQAWRARQLREGTEAAFFGKVDEYRGRRQMTNPAVDVVGQLGERTGAIIPVYPQSGKAEVSSALLSRLVGEVLRRSASRGFADPLDPPIRDRLGLCDRGVAYTRIHRPETMQDHRVAARRLVFDEFLRMQVGLVARKRALAAEHRGISHDVAGVMEETFVDGLPFELTEGQRDAMTAIAADMTADAPMHRLLQGDVGSGKTVVAVAAALRAVEAGSQAAVMAPTEVLAEQHHLSISAMLDGMTVPSSGTLTGDRPLRVELLTGRTPAARRRTLRDDLGAGDIDLVVGTHALLEEGARFGRLGLVVIDEQHRFGVEQRSVLRGKGDEPDVLVMTATPIPRTAAMLVYGDLDLTELRQMPVGRAPVTTAVVDASPLGRVEAYTRLRAEIDAGHQGYVVCPLVDGSDTVQAKAATEEFERLAADELAGLRIGLLHGQLRADDKESVMAQFRDGEIDVLVATTVIEVGVDVPNATVIVIEDADHFGLSQLHQLRGRVGRGGGASWCYLVSDPPTPEAEQRLAAMVESTDGFLLAERDLEIRGAGEVFGERQAGFTDLKLGRLPRDTDVVLDARAVAEEILDDDPALTSNVALREEVGDLLGDAVDFLFKS